MMSNIYAKSVPPESLVEHTNYLLKSFEELKLLITNNIVDDYSKYINRILYYHDQGKANIPFQNLIRKSLKLNPLAKTGFNKSLPHEWLSLSFISEDDEAYFHSIDNKDNNNLSFYDLACYSIAFHHSRNYLPVQSELKQQIKEIIENSELLEIKNELCTITDIKGIQQKIESPEYWPSYFPYVVYFKGILHKCDYAASAHIQSELAYNGNYAEHFSNGLIKRNILELHPIQKEAADHRDKSIIFIASTGAGKTEYSMNWINGDKAFYLLGLRTAVNVMYDRFMDMFSEKNVGLLHGESIFRLIDDWNENSDYEEDEDIFKQHTKIKQLSMPITVATADQLVPSVFKFPGFEFYYFTASYSKIVIDEIQSFAPEAIASIVVFLKEIKKLGGKFLLMTATLPPFVIKEFEELQKSGELINMTYFSQKKRHIIKLVDEKLTEETARSIVDSSLKTGKKILIVSNTVAGAQNLADVLSRYYPNVLHSRFIRNDRSKKENLILQETDFVNHPGNKGKACLWISTQIVEASLDIDFDILLTENATIDALFQRFGRCWRNREYESSEPNIFIFKPEDEKINSLIYDKHISRKTWDVLQKFNGLLITEETKQQIIEEVFSDLENTEYHNKYKKYKDLLVLGLRAGSKNEASKLFRDINNNFTVIPEDVYNNESSIIESLYLQVENRNLNSEDRLKAKENLYGFTVPVQIFNNKRGLLKDIFIDGRKMQKLDIYILKGVTYSYEKGAEFLKDYTDRGNFL